MTKGDELPGLINILKGEIKERTNGIWEFYREFLNREISPRMQLLAAHIDFLLVAVLVEKMSMSEICELAECDEAYMEKIRLEEMMHCL